MIRALLLLLPLCLAFGADDFADLRDRAKANKRLLVSTWLHLDADTEAKFDPLYQRYQQEMAEIERRGTELIKAYSTEISAGTLTDDRATRFLSQTLDIEADQVALRRKYLPLVSKVLPVQTAVRYIQLEGKLWAIARYEAASVVPLMPEN